MLPSSRIDVPRGAGVVDLFTARAAQHNSALTSLTSHSIPTANSRYWTRYLTKHQYGEVLLRVHSSLTTPQTWAGPMGQLWMAQLNVQPQTPLVDSLPSTPARALGLGIKSGNREEERREAREVYAHILVWPLPGWWALVVYALFGERC